MTRPNSCLAVIVLVVSTICLGTVAAQVSGPPGPIHFDTKPWLEDFQQLLQEMTSHYANLEWAVEERRMNLPNLRTQTEAALQHAENEQEARQIIDKFLDSFGDGHLELEWPKPQTQVMAAAQNISICDRLGYRAMGKTFVEFGLLSGFVPLVSPGSELFPGGLVKLGPGKTLAIVRIGIFSETGYPATCRKAVQQLGIADTAVCDDNCANGVQVRTADLLTTALLAYVKELRHAGATALLIDITHNGGGSDWVEVPPRVLSSKPLRDARLGFIKNAHWTSQLQDELKDVGIDLKNGKEQSSQVLHRAATTLSRAIAASREPCNREEVWTTGQLHCSIVVKDLLFASGVLSYAPPGSFAGWESRTTLFHPTRYAYSESRDNLPLYVLVDNETWSAAEYFAALLQDNHAAVVIGEVTGGAGCGYTNGGIPAKLKNSKAEVKMPDCVRLRADGSDEVNGITPDVLVPWTHRDSAYQRAEKLQNVLRRLTP